MAATTGALAQRDGGGADDAGRPCAEFLLDGHAKKSNLFP
jgi:hypothetical protein